MEQILFTTREQESLKAWMDDHGEVGQLIMREQPVAPELSEPGHAVMYWDAATDTMLCSVDGAPFVVCVAAAAGPGAPVGSTQFNDNGVFGGDAPIHVAAFGTDRQAIQDAIDATPAGGVVQFECAPYTLDATTITVDKPLTLRGCTMLGGGVFTPAPTVGTQLIGNTAAGVPMITIDTLNAVTVEGFYIAPAAGADGIFITATEAPTPPNLWSLNVGSIIRNNWFDGGRYQVWAESGKAAETIVQYNTFTSPTGAATWLRGLKNPSFPTANCDGGGYHFVGNRIEGAVVDGYRFTNTAAMTFTDNRVLGTMSGAGLHVFVGPVSDPCASSGPTQNLFTANQITNSGTGPAFWVEASFFAGDWTIGNNFFGAESDDVVFLQTVGGGANLFRITYTGNTHQTVSQVGKGALHIDGAQNVTVEGNALSMGSDASNYAFKGENLDIGVMVVENPITNPVFAATAYQGSGFTLVTHYNRPGFQTVATLPTANDGSTLWVNDATATNPCTGGGTGAQAIRVGGVWNCGASGVIAGAANEIAFFTGPSTITGDPDFTWEESVGRLLAFSAAVVTGNVQRTTVLGSRGIITLDGSTNPVLFSTLLNADTTSLSDDTSGILVAGGSKATLVRTADSSYLSNDGATATTDSFGVFAAASFNPTITSGTRGSIIAALSSSMAQTEQTAILGTNTASITTSGGGNIVSNSVILGGTGGTIDGAGGNLTNAVSLNGGIVVNSNWTTIGGDRTQIGSLPNGTLATGPLIVGVNAPTGTGAQAGLFQTTSEPPAGEGLVTLGQDNVAVSGWAFRGSTSTNPLYGGNFGVHFLGSGQTRGVEIDVQNENAEAGEGAFGEHVGLWLNRSGTYNASSAIEISSQDNRGWWHGIHFDPGGAGTGSDTLIKGWGIRWFRASSAQFISMVPADDFIPSANAIALYAFDSTTEKAKLTKRGQWWSRADDTSLVDPAFGFIDDPNTGMYQPAPDQLALGAGGVEVFKAVATPVVGTLTTGYMASVGTVFGSLGAVINGALIYCSDCQQTNPCVGVGTGAFALGINAAWDCSAAGSAGTGTVTGSGATTRLAVWDAATDITSFDDFTWDNTNQRLLVGNGFGSTGVVTGFGSALIDMIGATTLADSVALQATVQTAFIGFGGTHDTDTSIFDIGFTNDYTGCTTCFGLGHTMTLAGSNQFAIGDSIVFTGAGGSSAAVGFALDDGGFDGVVMVGSGPFTASTTSATYIVGQQVITTGPTTTPATMDIRHFGAFGNGSADDTAEIQAVIDAAESSGAEVLCSPGLYKTSAALTVTQPLVFRGTRGLAPSTLTGCIIIASNATQDIFNVSLPNTTSNPPYDFDGGAFVLEDVTLGASVVKTAGAGVFITNAGASCSGAILDKVAILDQWDGVNSDKACGVTIVNSRIAKWRNRGVHLENQSAVDGGSYRISGNYIFSLLGGAAIEWHSGGDMQITGNAIGTLGPYGIDITATNSGGGPSVATSMISVTGNEIESPSSAALNISAAAGQALTRVTATGNMMTCSGSGCSGIRTSEVTIGCVNSITMTGNVVSADNCFDVAGGDAVMISGNTCSTSWNGISVSAAALNVSAGENYIVAGSKVFNISNTTTSILTARPVTLTALPTAADGTRIWCSNCDPTATLLTCTAVGAQTGAMAVRTAGAWKCIG